MSENTEVVATPLTLEERVLQIEKALVREGILSRQFHEGEDITNGVWIDCAQPGGLAGFEVSFSYRCQFCHELHNGKTFIPAGTKDGLTYNILGSCREYSTMKVWKHAPRGS